MSPNASDDEYFQPSLRSLMGRDETPAEHDAESVTSVRTVSDAETVSDQTEGFDMVSEHPEGHDENMGEIFDDFTLDEVNEARRYTGAAKTQPRSVGQEEEDELRLSTNSDRTLKPSKGQLEAESKRPSRQLPGDYSTDPPVDSGADYLHPDFVVRGFHMAPHLYRAPDRPLRIMLVADVRTEQAVKTLIIRTLISAVIQDSYSIKVAEPQATADGNTLSALEYCVSYRDDDNPKGRTSTTVLLDHAVGTDLSKERLAMKSGNVVIIGESPLPDFAVFYHDEEPSRVSDASMVPTFPATLSGSAIAQAISSHNVPLLEMCANDSRLPELSCVTDPMKQKQDFVHLRRAYSTAGKEELQMDSNLYPVPLVYFTDEFSRQDLSHHLAFISKQKQEKVSPDVGRSKTLAGLIATKWWTTFLPLLLLATGLAVAQWMQWTVDASTALTVRRDVLQANLEKWGLHDVNASSVLRYPTTTAISSGTVTSQVAYPTAMDVVVTKPDQLFVSLPRNYGRTLSFGVLKNGKKLQVNATSLLDVVTLLSLDPEEAHGRVLVNVVTSNKPQINETVQVDLGNRLLQRATYEKAANRMQQTVQRDVSEVHSAAMAFQSALKLGACSAANTSASRVMAVRNGLFASALEAVHRLSDGYKFTANTTSRIAQSAGHVAMLARNEAMHDIKGMGTFIESTTSSVGTFLKNRVPGKDDFVRARKNSLKVRAKLQGKAAPPVQTPVRKNKYLSAVADVAEIPSRFTRQCRNFLRLMGSSTSATSQQAGRRNAVQSVAEKAAKKLSVKDKKTQMAQDGKTGGERQCKNKKAGLK